MLSEILDHWLYLQSVFQKMYDQEIKRCYDMLSHLFCAEGRGIEADEWEQRMRKDS